MEDLWERVKLERPVEADEIRRAYAPHDVFTSCGKVVVDADDPVLEYLRRDCEAALSGAAQDGEPS